MKALTIVDKPEGYDKLEAATKDVGFSMSSDAHIGSMLRTLIATKPNSNVLELGTGLGMSLIWMLDGMDSDSKITSIEYDPELAAIAKDHFEKDKRVSIVLDDAAKWLKAYNGEKFDVIFADAWPGKYSELDEVLQLLNVGAIYIVDDMNERPSWPKGHKEKAEELVRYLEKRQDLVLTKMNWASGIIIAAKK